MSEFLQHYVDWGLTDIVLISHTEKEVESGYNLEITKETVVARKGQGFVEVVAEKRVSFAPHAGIDIGRLSPAFPCHTTVRAGPHTAVRRVELSTDSQSRNSERGEVSIGQRDMQCR